MITKEKDTDRWIIFSRVNKGNFTYTFSEFLGTEEEAFACLLAERERDMAGGEIPYEELDFEETVSKEDDCLTTYFYAPSSEFAPYYIDYYAIPIVPGSEWFVASYLGGAITDYRFLCIQEGTKKEVTDKIKQLWKDVSVSVTGSASPAAPARDHSTHISMYVSIADTGCGDVIAVHLSALADGRKLTVEGETEE